jgi:antitoxin (DNA-binding transcriptional repressor) of toxin-antitoxin stability system
MKMVTLEQSTLDTCVSEAQRERVVIMRNGKPIALIVGVEGMDEEQLQLGSSDRFWKLVQERRAQKTLSRTELEQRVNTSERNTP